MSGFRGIKSNIPLLTVLFLCVFVICATLTGMRVGEDTAFDIHAQESSTVLSNGLVTDEGSASVIETTVSTDTTIAQDTTSVTSDTQVNSPVVDTTVPSETGTPPAFGSEDDCDFRYKNQLDEVPDVGLEYFKDALFIGDSRTVGFQVSTSLKATFFAKISLNISQLNKDNDVSRFITVNDNGTQVKCNVYEALEYKADYGKIYLCMGLSELGWDENAFFAQYRKTLDHLIAKMPDAKIYIQTIIPVTEERSGQNLYGVTNERVWLYNQKLSELAAEYGVYLVNPAELYLNEKNALPDKCAFDGVHLYGDYYRGWLEYLRTHSVG